MTFLNNLTGAIKQKVASVQATRAKMQKEADERAERKIEEIKAAATHETAKAEAEREKMRVQRKMYEAKAAVNQERAETKAARHKAGVYTTGEKLSKIGKSLGDSAAGFGKEAMRAYDKLSEAPKKKKSARPASSARPAAVRRRVRRG